MRKLICTTLAVAMMATSVPMVSSASINDSDAGKYVESKISAYDLNDGVLTQGYFKYTVFDGEASIAKCDTAASGTLNIPEMLGGYPVTAIGTSAFYECSGITKVVMPSTVTNISTSAFYGCTALTEIVFSSRLEKIGYYAFDGCTSLKSVTIPASVESIGEKPFRACSSLTAINVDAQNAGYASADGVLYNKSFSKLIDYPTGKADSTFTVPSSVTEIGNYSFFATEKLSVLNIPDSVIKLGEQAVRESKKLTAVNIGAGVSTLGNTVFTACPMLKEISVSSKNTTFSAEKGVLYSKDKKVLYTVGGGISGTFTIPESVVSVLGMSIASCNKIEEIVVTKNVATIEANAFRDCEKLENITVDAKNTNYASVDGVLFSKDNETLISFPGGRSGAYVVPAGTVKIEKYAFYSNKGLTGVDIAATVREIGNYAFMGASALQTAVFFGTVPASFGERVFENTDPGFAIYYMPEYRSVWAEGGRVVFNGYPIYELTKVGVNENGFEYLVAEGYARIKSYSGAGGVVTVPATIEGYPVSMIYEGLFKVRTDITSVTIESGIIALPDNMFYGCTALEVIVVPASVNSIGRNVFCGCTSLVNITLPSGLLEIPDGAFYACASLARITIPRTVERIGAEAFAGCNSLKSVTIPAAVRTVDAYAFTSCKSLTEVSVGSGVSTLGSNAFSKCSSLVEAGFDAMPPANIGSDVFMDANSDFKVSCFEEYMPYFDPTSSGEWLGYRIVLRDRVYDGFVYYAKEDNTIAIKCYRGEETALSIPASINGVAVTSIDDGAFANTEAIISIVVPDSVKVIGANAFAYCTLLEQVMIGSGTSFIGERAFDGCDSLAAITVSESNKNYASQDGALYDAGRTKLILFPDAYTGNVVLPSSVKTIAPYAFNNCKKITFIKLPNGLLTVGENAFSSCLSLESVVIPSTVTEIGSDAFRNCAKLTAACFKGNPPKFGANVFSGVAVTFMIKYLNTNSAAWKKQGGISYEGYDISAMNSFEEIRLVDNSTCRIDGAYIVNIPVKTIVVELALIEIASSGVRVVDSNGVMQSDFTVISTGDRIQLVQSGTVTDEYSAAVMGDINGDGGISSRDIAALQRSVAGSKVLFGAFYKAADMSDDGRINSRDIALLQRVLLNG